MNFSPLRASLSALLLLPVLTLSAPVRAGDFAADATARTTAATGFGLQGDAPGWLFLKDDVTHASKGDFWKAPASPAIAIITKFRETLAAAGVTLILAPVPSKAAVYPDKLLAGTAVDAVPSSQPFLESLKATGATIVDLETPFRAEREKTRVFCATD
ncbi:MAG: hypothetical protein JWL81_1023, partial [Verrucomicrobiales bacterium]|nr:hypothetical protein [Verrucomicrobiales bacterium]